MCLIIAVPSSSKCLLICTVPSWHSVNRSATCTTGSCCSHHTRTSNISPFWYDDVKVYLLSFALLLHLAHVQTFSGCLPYQSLHMRNNLCALCVRLALASFNICTWTRGKIYGRGVRLWSCYADCDWRNCTRKRAYGLWGMTLGDHRLLLRVPNMLFCNSNSATWRDQWCLSVNGSSLVPIV